ncbi:hypothetical protein [Corynebacterium coyleae]|uniref:hypothetical protein n=1 Tax=Corynebacterium coyleae TaxID=53374 RepID=UPI0025517BBA|nr:hypothetical protein [Corynebacterium coyleae]MDK8664764.1 hypothetical protein [Corynebacterium coyleae]MDK8707808.1 hypothetical protein [Corynebacterium coyleae]MDK8734692.1 hypothetical protein [Corynebacterium coyleae]MDK8893900.1 hypothetical protein [Corynebacterium coyleae]
MRTSQRSEILEAALRVMNAAEGGDITLDAVAHEAGLTTARLAADGLWGAQATGVSTLHGADLEAVVSSIRSLIEGTTP